MQKHILWEAPLQPLLGCLHSLDMTKVDHDDENDATAAYDNDGDHDNDDGDDDNDGGDDDDEDDGDNLVMIRQFSSVSIVG